MLRLLLASIPGLLLASCTVYVPMQPTMPLVQESKQIELAANVHLSPRLEATASYSPAPHVVLTGAGTVGILAGRRDYLRTRQGEIGVGGYWTMGQNGLLSAIGGAGMASTNRQFCAWGCDQFQAKQYKVFGQVGAAWELPSKTIGLTYRLARVQFEQVARDESLVPDFSTYRHELVLFNRYWLGQNEIWYLQSAAGVSISNLRAPRTENTSEIADRWFIAGIPSLLFSFGIVWQPHRLLPKVK